MLSSAESHDFFLHNRYLLLILSNCKFICYNGFIWGRAEFNFKFHISSLVPRNNFGKSPPFCQS